MKNLENLSNEELLAIYRLALEHQEFLKNEKDKLGEEEENERKIRTKI